jgi:hypothetical protein
MGMGEQIFQKKGIEHFYSHSLFKIDKSFFPTLKKINRTRSLLHRS